jgi:predicted AAA+ superfamily ATPase
MRYIYRDVMRDLQRKMVFIGGPRQVGKTTLAKRVMAEQQGVGRYFNWDAPKDRKAMADERWPHDNHGLLVFDELHKLPRWKSWVKGIYDTRPKDTRILVTGSARLDVYRRGGDSLMGRYHYWRLHPICLGEKQAGISNADMLERLLRVGGFPEPFFDNDPKQAARWRIERTSRLIREDLRDLEPIRMLTTLELFVDALRTRVGSLIVLANIAADLQVSPHTLKHWLEVLERMYLIFIVRPLVTNVSRSLQKPFKVYFFDNMDVDGDIGARFENLVATHLLKRAHYTQDRDGIACGLHYIRDRDAREVDFALTQNRKLVELIEAKWTDNNVSPALRFFAEKLQVPQATQIVGKVKQAYEQNRLRVQGPHEAFANAFVAS